MNTSTLKATRRDGRLEPIDLKKIHRILDWAAEGVNDISISSSSLMFGYKLSFINNGYLTEFKLKKITISFDVFHRFKISNEITLKILFLLKRIRNIAYQKINLLKLKSNILILKEFKVLTARLKSPLFNDNHLGIFIYYA